MNTHRLTMADTRRLLESTFPEDAAAFLAAEATANEARAQETAAWEATHPQAIPVTLERADTEGAQDPADALTATLAFILVALAWVLGVGGACWLVMRLSGGWRTAGACLVVWGVAWAVRRTL